MTAMCAKHEMLDGEPNPDCRECERQIMMESEKRCERRANGDDH